MDRGPAVIDGAAPRTSGNRGPRRLLAAGIAALVILLVVVAVLATRLGSTPPVASAQASPSASPSPPASLAVPVIYQRVGPSVVIVRTPHDLGTGVIVADSGTILTADHVVAGGGAIQVTFADGTTAGATVAGADATLDVATLTPARLPQVVVPATLGAPGGVGSPVVAIGNPLGLADSVSSGVISGLNRTADTSNGKFSGLIQFDASVNPGSSGGPLIDARGLVIGIVVSIASPDGKDAFAGIGFAVPIGAALGGGGPGSGNGPQI